jgi:hypothetical protein
MNCGVGVDLEGDNSAAVKVWGVAQVPGSSLVLGVQTKSPTTSNELAANLELGAVVGDPEHSILGVTFSQPRGTKTFFFVQHFAIPRAIVNPFEDDDITRIVNPLDVGLELDFGPKTSEPQTSAVASYQLNKNWRFRGLYHSGDGASLAVLGRVWVSAQPSQPMVTFNLNTNLNTGQIGFGFAIENGGNRSYNTNVEQGPSDAKSIYRWVENPSDKESAAQWGARGAQGDENKSEVFVKPRAGDARPSAELPSNDWL